MRCLSFMQSAARVAGGVRRLLALAMLAICPVAFGQSLGNTFSDLWWKPNESGWGVTVDHQQDVMFLTFFVYGADGSPYWVTGVLNRVGANTTAPFVFTGNLAESRGPSFGNPFNSSLVTYRPVGTATFTASLINAATLVYSIDGVTVTKSLERQTLRFLDFSGLYNGTVAFTTSECPVPSQNGQTFGETGQMTVLQTGSSFKLLLQPTSGGTCGFVGTYSQTGSIGSVVGNAQCSGNAAGTFTLDGLQWTLFGMSGRLTARQPGNCTLTGILGGTGLH
jgi:hypothetical protein